VTLLVTIYQAMRMTRSQWRSHLAKEQRLLSQVLVENLASTPRSRVVGVMGQARAAARRHESR